MGRCADALSGARGQRNVPATALSPSAAGVPVDRVFHFLVSLALFTVPFRGDARPHVSKVLTDVCIVFPGFVSKGERVRMRPRRLNGQDLDPCRSPSSREARRLFIVNNFRERGPPGVVVISTRF